MPARMIEYRLYYIYISIQILDDSMHCAHGYIYPMLSYVYSTYVSFQPLGLTVRRIGRWALPVALLNTMELPHGTLVASPETTDKPQQNCKEIYSAQLK